MKHRCALAAAIEAVEHQAVEMNIQVGGGAKAPDEGDGAGVGFAAFEPCLDFHAKRRGGSRAVTTQVAGRNFGRMILYLAPRLSN